jgi:predicted PurR-regulated permease PerM
MVLATGAILLLGWGVRRVLATLLVFLLGLVVLAGVLRAVVRPIVQEDGQFARRRRGPGVGAEQGPRPGAAAVTLRPDML